MARKKRWKGLRSTSRRLAGWNYAAPGHYFVTICVKKHRSVFGSISDGEMLLSDLGETADKFWVAIPSHHEDVSLDAYTIMPNHLHGILILHGTFVETLHATSLQSRWAGEQSQQMKAISPKKGTLGSIVRSYKSAVTRWARRNGAHDFSWQQRYHDHIIRDQRSLQTIRTYIEHNPARWHRDRFYVGDEPPH